MPSRQRIAAYFTAGAGILALFSLARCSSSKASSPATPPAGALSGNITGTAAQGDPIVGGTITIKDSTGATAAGTTASDGTYTISAAGLVPPLLLKITSGNTTLFSIGNAAGVVNVTPLTDLIVKVFYQVSGTDAATAFSTFSASTPTLNVTTEKIISATVVGVMAQWLQAAGVSTATFDPVTTAFTANGSGVDGVLKQTTVAANLTVTVTSGTTTQTSTVGVSSTGVTVTTTTSNGSTTTTSTTTTNVPTSSAEVAALNGANATLASFVSTISAKGTNLAASDITPLLATGFLNSGLNATLWAEQTAGNFQSSPTAGVTETLQIQAAQVLSFDATNNILSLSAPVIVTQTSAGVTSAANKENFLMQFKLQGSSWLFYGDQKLAQIELTLDNRNDSNNLNTPVVFHNEINVDVQEPQGNFSGVTVSGGTDNSASIFNSTALNPEATLSETFGGQSVFFDHWVVLSNPLVSTLAVGTPFTVTVTPTSGSPVTYTITTLASTNDTSTMSIPGGLSLTAAQTAQVVSWTLPSTFAIQEIDFMGNVYTQSNLGGIDCQVNASTSVGPTTTSATITLPTTCSGDTVVSADYDLSFTGTHGERVVTGVNLQ